MKKLSIIILLGIVAILLIGSSVFYVNGTHQYENRDIALVTENISSISDSVSDFSDAVGLLRVKPEEGTMLYDEVVILAEISEKCHAMMKDMLYTGSEEASRDENVVGYYLSAMAFYADSLVSENMTSISLIESSNDLLVSNEVIMDFVDVEYEDIDDLYSDMANKILANSIRLKDNSIYKDFRESYEKFYD